MIVNFFLDNRDGGPHIYSKYLMSLLKKKNINIYCGKNKSADYCLSNFRKISKILYPIEIIINIIKILNNKIIFNSKYFLSYNIYNIAPIICGKICKKKTYWFILEKPTKFSSFMFKIIYHLTKPQVVCIAKNIAKKLNIKKFNIYCPEINKNFWKKNSKKKMRKIINLTMIGNINYIKNFINALNFINNSHYKFIVNIIGNRLDTQINYYNNLNESIKNLNSINLKINIFEKKKSTFIKKILNKTDIFLQPSISEGLSIALMEAMSMETICLVSNESNVSDIIKNNHNGFVFNLSQKSFNKKIDYINNLSLTKLNKIKINARQSIIKLKKLNNFQLI
jgi:glycosyltransferase involved in cell wall biosynthesis